MVLGCPECGLGECLSATFGYFEIKRGVGIFPKNCYEENIH